MKKTRKQIKAVGDCIKMWTWIHDNPFCDKDVYFTYVLGKDPDSILNACFLCDEWHPAAYYPDEEGEPSIDGCKGCPLAKEGLLCGSSNNVNPYILWVDAKEDRNQKEFQKQAKRIIDACNDWLTGKGGKVVWKSK